MASSSGPFVSSLVAWLFALAFWLVVFGLACGVSVLAFGFAFCVWRGLWLLFPRFWRGAWLLVRFFASHVASHVVSEFSCGFRMASQEVSQMASWGER